MHSVFSLCGSLCIFLPKEGGNDNSKPHSLMSDPTLLCPFITCLVIYRIKYCLDQKKVENQVHFTNALKNELTT